jgi:hypothetical protein
VSIKCPVFLQGLLHGFIVAGRLITNSGIGFYAGRRLGGWRCFIWIASTWINGILDQLPGNFVVAQRLLGGAVFRNMRFSFA